MNEFALNEIEAQMFFQIFDKDQNEVLSLWEFRQFNQTVGTKAHEMIQLFHKLKEPATGYVDIGKTFDALTHVDSGKGKLTEDEIVTFLQTTAGDSKTIDLHTFLNMMSRIKIYTGGL
ncbi:unnamed protein product [Lymnaea stagnalis]|uniref:EF-hand domain-containing protein n=1 Tax=Lymnaea stagnalis TaxID=6523 RepID=A0AAV2IKC6_LYMST